MPDPSRDQVNGRSLAGAFARCERRLNTVVVLKSAPANGASISMGQSYAQNFPKPSRPQREAMALQSPAPRQICNNQTARRANQLRILASYKIANGRSSDRKCARAETHFSSTANGITTLTAEPEHFSIFKNQKSCILCRSRPHERGASRSS
ncbi:hypothetical protein ACQR1H_02455 [Bradyrhizobium sp. HKCCYLRH2015]|uniref:hypothetical protein n=1 Tax=Bradyrhizobium TaxID=374 RepID=UPI003EBC64CB